MASTTPRARFDTAGDAPRDGPAPGRASTRPGGPSAGGAARPFPARIFAVLVAALGLVLAGGGAYLLTLGGSPYYVLTGVALLATGWWLWRGDERGAWLYGAIVLATVVWAILDAGFNFLALLARIGLIAGLGLWLTLPFVRRGLTWRGRFRRPDRRITALVVAAMLVVAAALAPRVHPATMAEDMSTPAPAAPAAPTTGNEEWPSYGRDLTGNRYNPNAQITPANVSRLKLAWSFRTGDLPKERFSVENTPLEIGGRLFVCTPSHQVIALDARTGKQQWRFVPPADHAPLAFPPTCRGVSYHADQAGQQACGRRILVGSLAGDLWALDADTGRPCADFGRGGAISLLDGIGPKTNREWENSSPGTVVGDVIIIGAKVKDGIGVHMPSGVIRAFDVHSGRLVWAWDMGHPDRAGAPPPGETYTESTPNAWATFSADPALSLVYVPTGSPSPDFFGGYRRPFDEKYATSLVALDTRTGRPLWSFQLVHHDLWDQDVAPQPLLVDWPTASGPRKAVVQLSKTGDIFVLDRATGAPIVPVRELPVPQNGGAPDDRRSPTQPFSALSLMPRRLTESDMWGLTPIDQMLCRISYRQSRYDGPYTLPGATMALGYPEISGVFNWGGGTIDPRNNVLIANTMYTAWQMKLLPRAKGDTRILSTEEEGFLEMAGTPYRYTSNFLFSRLIMPCKQPPWGELVGIDMRTGKIAWRNSIGTGRNSGPLGIHSHIPFAIGTPNFGGNSITGGGLSFIAATADQYLRAYDVRTGDELWRASLPAAGIATPMSYVAGGRQYIVIAAGGHAYLPSKKGDYILAYTLDGHAAAD